MIKHSWVENWVESSGKSERYMKVLEDFVEYILKQVEYFNV